MSGLAQFSAPPHKRLMAAGLDLLFVFSIATFLSPLVKESGFAVRFDWLVAGVYFAYQALFLKLWAGQSPGRRLLDTVVVRTSGGELTWLEAIARPAARVIAFAATPDLAFRVVWPGYDAFQIPGFGLIELALLLSTASRRTLADYVARTIVANVPPLQPHRAPAAPMYSEHDAEFGFPPSRPRPDAGPGRPKAGS